MSPLSIGQQWKNIPKGCNGEIILPMYKKDDTKDCTILRGITLKGVREKVLTRIKEKMSRENWIPN